MDDVENSLRNREVFGILNWKWRSNTGSEYTLPTSGDGLHQSQRESLTRVKQHLLLDRLLFDDTLNRENPLTQIGYNLGSNESKLAK